MAGYILTSESRSRRMRSTPQFAHHGRETRYLLA
jgi:hypothetical protein